MTPQDQLDYALGQVDEAQLDLVNHQMALDPSLADSLSLLRNRLDLFLDDGEDWSPPADLMRRTILRVEIERRRHRTILDYMPQRVNFRWADVAVAASILIAGFLTMIPSIQSSRLASRTAACADNLHFLGMGLNRYATIYQNYPYPDRDSAMPYAGTFAIQLKEVGLLDNTMRLDCPVNGRAPMPAKFPCLEDLYAMEQARPRSAPCLVHNEYAYTLGFHRGHDRHPLHADLGEQYPLLADVPPHDPRRPGFPTDGNSTNHYGTGQNVLFVGGHVKFITSRRLANDRDMYRNDAERIAPGLHDQDFVMAIGLATPFED